MCSALLLIWKTFTDRGPESILTQLLGTHKVSCCPLLCEYVILIYGEKPPHFSHDMIFIDAESVGRTIFFHSSCLHQHLCCEISEQEESPTSVLIWLDSRKKNLWWCMPFFLRTVEHIYTWGAQGIKKKHARCATWIKASCPGCIWSIQNPSEPLKTNTKGSVYCQNGAQCDPDLSLHQKD